MTEATPTRGHVISGMLRKRAELTGRLEAVQAEFRQLLTDLDNLDAAIRLFDPDIDLEIVKPRTLPPKAHAFHGEITRLVLGILRTAPAPLTTAEIVMSVIATRKLDRDDKRLWLLMVKRVGACLRYHKARGLVRHIAAEGRLVRWEIAR